MTLAVHWNDCAGNPWYFRTVCGRWVQLGRSDRNPQRVTCKSCLRAARKNADALTCQDWHRHRQSPDNQPDDDAPADCTPVGAGVNRCHLGGSLGIKRDLKPRHLSPP